MKRSFACGCWGKHQPPYVDHGSIVFAVGVGYESRKHLHGQNVYVVDIDPVDQRALVEMRKFGDCFGAGLWRYLIGVEQGTPWACHVPATLQSVAEAAEYLKPAEVKRAIQAGKQVKRQGDWFFIPVAKPGRAQAPSTSPG